MCAAPLLRVICATNPCTWASASWIVARIGAPRAHTPSQQSSLERFPWNFAEIAGIFNFWDVGRRFRVRVYRRLCWSSGAHPSAHRRGERGCQNLSDVSGQERLVAWLSTENRRRSQFLGPECDVEKAKLSSVSFFSFWEKGWWVWEIFGSCTSSFMFRFFFPYIDCCTCCHLSGFGRWAFLLFPVFFVF